MKIIETSNIAGDAAVLCLAGAAKQNGACIARAKNAVDAWFDQMLMLFR